MLKTSSVKEAVLPSTTVEIPRSLESSMDLPDSSTSNMWYGAQRERKITLQDKQREETSLSLH